MSQREREQQRLRWPSTSGTVASADNALGQMYPAPFVQRRLAKTYAFFDENLAKLGAMDHVRACGGCACMERCTRVCACACAYQRRRAPSLTLVGRRNTQPPRECTGDERAGPRVPGGGGRAGGARGGAPDEQGGWAGGNQRRAQPPTTTRRPTDETSHHHHHHTPQETTAEELAALLASEDFAALAARRAAVGEARAKTRKLAAEMYDRLDADIIAFGACVFGGWCWCVGVGGVGWWCIHACQGSSELHRRHPPRQHTQNQILTASAA